MRRIEDEDLNRPGSEADQARSELFSDAEGYQSVNRGQDIDPDPGLYDSPNDYRIPGEGSGYQTQNPYRDPEYRSYRRGQDFERKMERAKRIAPYEKTRRFGKKLGDALGQKDFIEDGIPFNRAHAKDLAKKKARQLVKDKIGKKIADKGLRKGFSKGLSKGAAKTGKEAAKRLGQAASKGLAKGSAKAGAKVGAQAGTKIAQAGVTAAGVGTGAATFGLGFILSILVNIAISLGINDAVDALFKLGEYAKSGNKEDLKEARFLIIRAGAKVGFFIYFLLAIIGLITIGGMIFAIPLLFWMNVYMILGMVFKKVAIFQGVVWWEKIVIIIADVFAFIFALVFILSLGYYLCTTTGLGQGGVQGAVAGAIVSAYDWWNETTVGSVAEDFCKFVKDPSSGSSSSTTNSTTPTNSNSNTSSNTNTQSNSNSSGP